MKIKICPDRNGHFVCPYCSRILTPIVREWIPAITDYICHWCQIGYKVSMSRVSKNDFLKILDYRFNYSKLAHEYWIAEDDMHKLKNELKKRCEEKDV